MKLPPALKVAGSAAFDVSKLPEANVPVVRVIVPRQAGVHVPVPEFQVTELFGTPKPPSPLIPVRSLLLRLRVEVPTALPVEVKVPSLFVNST